VRGRGGGRARGDGGAGESEGEPVEEGVGDVVQSCEFPHNHSPPPPPLLSRLLLFLSLSTTSPSLSTSSLPILSTFSSLERSTASWGVNTGMEGREWEWEWLRDRDLELDWELERVGERRGIGRELAFRGRLSLLGVGLVHRPCRCVWGSDE